MKYIKTYEYRTKQPKIGDYVLVTDFEIDELEVKNFIETNIGQIIEIDKSAEVPYCVVFEKVPIEYKIRPYFGFDCKDKIKNCRWFKRDEILNFSSNKEDLEVILAAKKYNL